MLLFVLLDVSACLIVNGFFEEDREEIYSYVAVSLGDFLYEGVWEVAGDVAECSGV